MIYKLPFLNLTVFIYSFLKKNQFKLFRKINKASAVTAGRVISGDMTIFPRLFEGFSSTSALSLSCSVNYLNAHLIVSM